MGRGLPVKTWLSCTVGVGGGMDAGMGDHVSSRGHCDNMRHRATREQAETHTHPHTLLLRPVETADALQSVRYGAAAGISNIRETFTPLVLLTAAVTTPENTISRMFVYSRNTTRMLRFL